MRMSLFLIPTALLLTAPAAALELQMPTDASGVPVTTGAIMEAAKVVVPLPEGESAFSGARVLSDAEIAALIPSSYSATGDAASPAIMAMAKLAIGAAG